MGWELRLLHLENATLPTEQCRGKLHEHDKKPRRFWGNWIVPLGYKVGPYQFEMELQLELFHSY